MNQKSHLNIKKEKEKDENKSVNIIKEILNTTTQLNDFIKKAIQMNIKIIEVNECIEMVKNGRLALDARVASKILVA